MAAAKLLSISCIRNESNLSPKPHYPSMLKYPKGISAKNLGKSIITEGSEKRAIFSVIGMSCSACAASVEKAIKRLPGIREAVVDFLNRRAQVFFYPSFVNEEQIRETIEDVGFEASLIEDDNGEASTRICRFHIKGMTCTTCANSVETSLVAVHGVKKAQVALATEEAEIHYDPKLVSYNELLEAVEDSGFEAILISTGEDISKVHLKVDGANSDHSWRMVESSLQALQGVQTVDMDETLLKVSLSYKPDVTGPRSFIEVIESTGSVRTVTCLVAFQNVSVRTVTCFIPTAVYV